jgi:hypothetical protein
VDILFQQGTRYVFLRNWKKSAATVSPGHFGIGRRSNGSLACRGRCSAHISQSPAYFATSTAICCQKTTFLLVSALYTIPEAPHVIPVARPPARAAAHKCNHLCLQQRRERLVAYAQTVVGTARRLERRCMPPTIPTGWTLAQTTRQNPMTPLPQLYCIRSRMPRAALALLLCLWEVG